MTHITPRTITRGFISHAKRITFPARAEFFNRLDRGGFFAFSTRADILLSEILWSLRSTQSKYRIDRVSVFAFFMRTDSLLTGNPLELREQMEYPREPGDRRP
jgi:hypothetical protein